MIHLKLAGSIFIYVSFYAALPGRSLWPPRNSQYCLANYSGLRGQVICMHARARAEKVLRTIDFADVKNEYKTILHTSCVVARVYK